MISGPQENFDQLGRREEAVRPESPRDHNIENERELEEFAQDRGNNLELEAEKLKKPNWLLGCRIDWEDFMKRGRC
jgi:hypothetical protein